eukprot:2546394-Amphidinium_carterae.1
MTLLINVQVASRMCFLRWNKCSALANADCPMWRSCGNNCSFKVLLATTVPSFLASCSAISRRLKRQRSGCWHRNCCLQHASVHSALAPKCLLDLKVFVDSRSVEQRRGNIHLVEV